MANPELVYENFLSMLTGYLGNLSRESVGRVCSALASRFIDPLPEPDDCKADADIAGEVSKIFEVLRGLPADDARTVVGDLIVRSMFDEPWLPNSVVVTRSMECRDGYAELRQPETTLPVSVRREDGCDVYTASVSPYIYMQLAWAALPDADVPPGQHVATLRVPVGENSVLYGFVGGDDGCWFDVIVVDKDRHILLSAGVLRHLRQSLRFSLDDGQEIVIKFGVLS